MHQKQKSNCRSSDLLWPPRAGMYHRNVILAAHVSEPFVAGAEARRPAHLPICMDEALLAVAGIATPVGAARRGKSV